MIDLKPSCSSPRRKRPRSRHRWRVRLAGAVKGSSTVAMNYSWMCWNLSICWCRHRVSWLWQTSVHLFLCILVCSCVCLHVCMWPQKIEDVENTKARFLFACCGSGAPWWLNFLATPSSHKKNSAVLPSGAAHSCILSFQFLPSLLPCCYCSMYMESHLYID